jgi:putative acyl-CoA dehydrogenase
MSYGAGKVFRRHGEHLPVIRDVWLPALQTGFYDQSIAPVQYKRGALIGMSMTERQGGSDVRAVETYGEPLGDRVCGGAYRLNGQKWFLSAPMCDAFLVLAQTDNGVS